MERKKQKTLAEEIEKAKEEELGVEQELRKWKEEFMEEEYNGQRRRN